jgi:hypothetical protein
MSPSTSPAGHASTPPASRTRAATTASTCQDRAATRRPGGLAALREKASEALGRRPATGLLLLHDLRDLHLAAARNSLHWEMLAQAAQATRDERLLALVTDCHPQTLRQLRWTNTEIKILAPQVLTSV